MCKGLSSLNSSCTADIPRLFTETNVFCTIFISPHSCFDIHDSEHKEKCKFSLIMSFKLIFGFFFFFLKPALRPSGRLVFTSSFQGPCLYGSVFISQGLRLPPHPHHGRPNIQSTSLLNVEVKSLLCHLLGTTSIPLWLQPGTPVTPRQLMMDLPAHQGPALLTRSKHCLHVKMGEVNLPAK